MQLPHNAAQQAAQKAPVQNVQKKKRTWKYRKRTAPIAFGSGFTFVVISCPALQ